MVSYNPRVDKYIADAADFAKPILIHIRELIHAVCPDVEEAWKWSFPVFIYKGEIMCNMSAFKNHASFGFWKASIMPDPDSLFSKEKEGMGHVGKLLSIKDLPKDAVLKKYIKAAMKLNDEGIKVVRAQPIEKGKKDVVVPDYWVKLLKEHREAEKKFAAFSYSHRKEYVTWFEDAKTEATRNKRMAQAIEWITEGKGRNWKYEKGQPGN